MSQNQAIDGQWRLLINAACKGGWQDYLSAEKRLLSVDRLGKISPNKRRAVKIIALARAGYTDEASIECNMLQQEDSELIQTFVVPRLKNAPEQNSEEFVAFTESLIRTAQRKAFVHSLQKNTKQRIANFIRIDKAIKKHWAISSAIAGVILISIAISYRFNTSSSITNFFDNFSKTVETNNPSLLWDSIPYSLQFQSNSLIHQAVTHKMTVGASELYDDQWKTTRRVIKLLENKRAFIMETPVVKGLLVEFSPSEKEQVEEIYDETIQLLNALATSQLSTIKGMQNFDIGKFLDRNGQQIMGYAVKLLTVSAINNIESAAVLQQLQSLRYIESTVTEEGHTTAAVRLVGLLPNFYGLTTDIQMIKLEGKWVPLEFAAGMQLAILDAQKEISNSAFTLQMEDAAIMGMSITLINSLITPLEEAATQSEFNNALVEASLKVSRFSSPYF